MPHAAIIHGLKFLMQNNIFKFGDTFWHQKQGTTMIGTPPAPPYAILYFGIHKLKIMPLYKPSFLDHSHYFDGMLGAWIHNLDPNIDNQNFLASMNCFGKLKWEFMPLNKPVDFMDLTLHITPHDIKTSLFKKLLSLYLYIPPHLAHAPGILRGLVFRMMEHIFWLTSQVAICNLFLCL
jgi:hypothetical protein